MLSKPHNFFSHKKGKLLDWFKTAAYFLVATLALNAEQGFAQTTLLPNIKSNFQSNLTQSLVENGKVSADSLLELLSTWNNYPDAYKADKIIFSIIRTPILGPFLFGCTFRKTIQPPKGHRLLFYCMGLSA